MEILAIVPAGEKETLFLSPVFTLGSRTDLMIGEYGWMSVCVFSSAAFYVLSSFKLGKKELICLWIMIFLNGT